MSVQHKDIPNDGLHEPKGASTASIGQMYISDGAGSGAWANSLANPDDIKVERLLDAISLATSQEPTGLDAPLQIELGAAQFTTADPVSLAADGTVTFNQAGTYRIKVSLAIGRSGGAGVSSIYARAVVNGVQAGQSIHFKIGSADSLAVLSKVCQLQWIGMTTHQRLFVLKGGQRNDVLRNYI